MITYGKSAVDHWYHCTWYCCLNLHYLLIAGLPKQSCFMWVNGPRWPTCVPDTSGWSSLLPIWPISFRALGPRTAHENIRGTRRCCSRRWTIASERLSSIWKIWKCDLHWKEFSDGGDNDDDDDDEEEGDWIGMHGTRWHRQIDILIYITIVYSIYIVSHCQFLWCCKFPRCYKSLCTWMSI